MNYAIILSAGKGTRMKVDMPKCAVPLLGKPMVSYLIDSLKEFNNIDNVICVVGHKKEVFYDLLKDDVQYAVQREQLGTGDAVKCCKELITGDGYAIILPGDTPLIDGEIIQGLINEHISSNNILTIGTIILDNPYGYGRIVRDNKGNVINITEEKDASDDVKKIKEINSGLMCVDNKLLFEALSKVKNNNVKGEYYLTDIVSILASNNKVGTHTFKDAYKLAGINDLYHLYEIETELRKEINKRHMLNGVIIECADTVTIGPDVIIENNTTIRKGTILLGNTIIKGGAIVGPDSEILNSTIEEGATVKQSVVYDSKVSKGASVGPFTHLRMNTVVGEGDRIGNFVEIKNSIIGTKTNVSHLTYVGDTDCGSGVNFGCGTVTVNYDGKNKFRTTIGDNVFIGCNSNLIAPVTLADNSFVAAGSTITESLEKDDFAIARAKQTTKKGYAKRFGYKKF